MRIDSCPAVRMAKNSILIDDECTSTRCEAGNVLSGSDEAKFHSSSVVMPVRPEAPGCPGESATSTNVDGLSVGLAVGYWWKGEDDLEPDATSDANGSAEA